MAHSGAEVAVVEMADQVMSPIDYSMATLVHEHLLQKGVKLYLRQAVSEIEPAGDGVVVKFQSGMSLDADMVVLSIGVRPETKLAVEAGLALGK